MRRTPVAALDTGIGSVRSVRTPFSATHIKLALWTIAAIFAIYRLATFVPEPLDGPHTLRPILNAWFDSFLRHFDSPETAYGVWRTTCFWALLIPPALALLHFMHTHGTFHVPDRVMSILGSRWLFWASIAAALLLCRFPTLLAYQMNPDEGEFLSAAHKLFYDANFFNSVDTGTSGPLNIYPLMLPAIVGFSPDYASSRVLILLIAFGVIYISYRSVRMLAPDSVARLAVLPLAGAFAIFEQPNLLHYSSEQIPILLVALAIYLAVRVLNNPAARAPLFFLGVLTSAGFLSKMQSVPILGAAGAVAMLYTFASGGMPRLWNSVLLFVAGLLPLQILNAVVSLAAGVWKNFWMSYIVSNQRYADFEANFILQAPQLFLFFIRTPEVGYFIFTCLALYASFVVQRFRSRAGEQQSILPMVVVGAAVLGVLIATLLPGPLAATYSYLILLAIFVTALSIPALMENGSFGTDPVRWFGLLAIVTIAAAVFSIYRPHREFPHYLLFLFPPVSALMAWMLIRQTAESTRLTTNGTLLHSFRLWFPLLFTALTMTYATYLWGTRGTYRFPTTVATIRQPEGDYIRALTKPESRIFVWGWTPDPYLGSGRVAGTRDLNLFYQFLAPQEITLYYRARLLQDLRRDPPELIVDAVGPVSWTFIDQGAYGLSTVPEIDTFVHDFYRHVADAFGERFYIRADLASRAASVPPPKHCSPGAVRCAEEPRRDYSEGVTNPVIDDLPAIEMPAHARMDVQFTPFGRQTDYATVVNSEATPNSFKGFRLQNRTGDLYELLVGLGDSWAFSKPILLADSRSVLLSIDFSGTEVQIRVNGTLADTMHLPQRMSDSPGPITVGKWIAGFCRFNGTIDFFEVVDLDAAGQTNS